MKNSKFLTALLTLSVGSVMFLWGCGDDDTDPPAPVAGFSFTVDEATGGTVTFANTSENATNYAWDFGDGNTSTDESPVNTYAANGDYTVELVASNDAGTSSTSSETIAIALIPVAGFSFMIDEATGGTVTFANTSENATSYSWDFGDGNTSTDENPENTYAANGDYTVELVASNDAGTSNSSSQTIAISLVPVAGFSYEASGSTVTFTNTSKNATSYAWDFGDGNGSTDENPVNTYAANGDYTVELVASNDAGATHSFSMDIEITAATTNAAPVFANTSYSFNVASDATDGAVVGIVSAVDTDGDMLTYMISGTDAGHFAINNNPVASGTEVSITVATNADLPSLTSPVALTVEVSDGTDQVTANVEITIAAGNVAPVFDQTAYMFTVVSDAAIGTSVGTISATDSNTGAMLTYSLSGTDADHFAIDNTAVASGTDVSITVAANADLSSLTSPVALTVTVTDEGTLTATATVAITITAAGINVAPVFASTDYTFNVASDAVEGAVVGTVSATDSNAGDLLTYLLSGEGADNFAISSTPVASGEEVSVTVAANADLSSLSSPVALMVEVSDGTDEATANVEITITVGNVAPVFDQTDYTFVVNEDAESGDVVDAVSATDSNAGSLLTYILSGTGADNFAISNTAVASGTPVQITVSSTASLDHETTTSYTLEVQASDDASPALTATAAVTINVNDVNDNAPVFAQASYMFNVNENSPVDTEVGTVAATDADANTTLEYSIVGTQTDFDIDTGTGEITVASAALDFETTTSYTLQVEASDGTKTATADVTINVDDINEAPTFTGAPYTFGIDENSAMSMMVGTVVATDIDANTTLEYSIVGTQTDFDIDSGTGEIKVASAALDFETTTSYTLEVKVSDGAMPALTATAAVTINVNDLNDEAPVFGETAYTFELAETAESGDEVGTVVATDADAGTTLAYSITPSQTNFDIDATGIITVAAGVTLDNETDYMLMVQASDGTNMGMAMLNINIKADYDADGDGLIDINNLEQLNAMRWDLDGDGMPAAANTADYEAAFPDAATFDPTPTGYELMRDLDFDEDDSYAGVETDQTWSEAQGTTSGGWDPIGDLTSTTDFTPYTAVFDGNNYTLSHLYINRGTTPGIGLFAALGVASTVSGVGLMDVNIEGSSSYVGGLVGFTRATITACHATGTVSAFIFGGGLVGYQSGGSIMACYASVAVTGIDILGVAGLGGLVGVSTDGGNIIASYATGNVVANMGNQMGGLVGINSGGTSGGTSSTGSNIMVCYATGAVSGMNQIGGLLGTNQTSSTVTACYATGAVTGASSVSTNGLVGQNDGAVSAGTVTASYFDTETSTQTDATQGKTTSELKTPTVYDDNTDATDDSSIYETWNLDTDNADGDDVTTTGTDDPWDFGTSSQYPVLKVDFDRDGSTADDVTRQRQ